MISEPNGKCQWFKLRICLKSMFYIDDILADTIAFISSEQQPFKRELFLCNSPGTFHM